MYILKSPESAIVMASNFVITQVDANVSVNSVLTWLVFFANFYKIAKEFGINPNTLTMIIKQRPSITQAFELGDFSAFEI
jgi:uncharacterized Fe-S cluster-containing radical SAM superfamily enzyme